MKFRSAVIYGQTYIPRRNPSAISGGYFIFFFWGGGGRGDGGGGGEKEGARVRDFFLLRIQI